MWHEEVYGVVSRLHDLHPWHWHHTSQKTICLNTKRKIKGSWARLCIEVMKARAAFMQRSMEISLLQEKIISLITKNWLTFEITSLVVIIWSFNWRWNQAHNSSTNTHSIITHAHKSITFSGRGAAGSTLPGWAAEAAARHLRQLK